MSAPVHASSRVETSFPFRCECGYRGLGSVVGEGYSDGSIREAALDAAEGAAFADALSSVELAACPRCGERDAPHWRAWTMARAARACMLGALAALLTLAASFLLRQELDALPLLAGGGVFVTFLVGSLSLSVWLKRRASNAVAFAETRGGDV